MPACAATSADSALRRRNRKVAMAVGMGIYFSHVTVWENVSASSAGKGDALTIYQQPAYLRTPNVLARVEG